MVIALRDETRDILIWNWLSLNPKSMYLENGYRTMESKRRAAMFL